MSNGQTVTLHRCPHGVCCPPYADSTEQRLCALSGGANETCAATRSGFLCGECLPGYTEALGTYLCRQCDGPDVGMLILGCMFVFLGVSIVVWRGRMQRGHRSFLKVLILKVALHFYQVADLIVGVQERTHARALLAPLLQVQ